MVDRIPPWHSRGHDRYLFDGVSLAHFRMFASVSLVIYSKNFCGMLYQSYDSGCNASYTTVVLLVITTGI